MRPITPHEPEEELLSVEDAFADAARSEALWRDLEHEHPLKQVRIELTELAYGTLEHLAARRHEPVPAFIQHVLEDLLATFSPTA